MAGYEAGADGVSTATLPTLADDLLSNTSTYMVSLWLSGLEDKMKSLLTLPHEVLHSVLTELDPADLGTICRCSHGLNAFVKDNRHLHKELYLRCWDDPSTSDPESDILWEDELHKLVKFQKLLASQNSSAKKAEVEFLTTTAVKLLDTAGRDAATSLNIATLIRLFDTPSNVQDLMCGSSLFSGAKGIGPIRTRAGSSAAESAAQFSAKLHCLRGLPIQHTGSKLEPLPMHPYARARVYDLRRFTMETMWGPFRDDGSQRVDWERMEAIMLILDYNFKLFLERASTEIEPSWMKPFHGVTPHSYTPLAKLTWPVEPRTDLEMQDPYNVTGTWLRIVCFLDYHELFAYNFEFDAPKLEIDRDPLDTEEAIRLIIMKLRVSSIEAPGEDDGQALPVVHFQGTSRSLHSHWDPNANSDIRVIKGSVRLTKEGEVRWTTFSVYHGEERWRSESVQIGGPNSARGVMGNWFDKNFDPRGPCGPDCIWKISNGFESEKANFSF